MKVFEVGFSRVDITPPLGVPMAGYTFLRKASAVAAAGVPTDAVYFHCTHTHLSPGR